MRSLGDPVTEAELPDLVADADPQGLLGSRTDQLWRDKKITKITNDKSKKQTVMH